VFLCLAGSKAAFLCLAASNVMPYAGSLCWPAGFLLYDPAPQATRQGWPYSIRAARAAGGAVVSRRATPGGWPALSTC